MRAYRRSLGCGVMLFGAVGWLGCSEQSQAPSPSGAPTSVEVGASLDSAAGTGQIVAAPTPAGADVDVGVVDPAASGTVESAPVTADANPGSGGESGLAMGPGAYADAGVPVASDDGSVDSGMAPDEGAAASSADLYPIEPPVADDCITDVSAGDHTYNCQGITFLTLVDPQCIERACGLIVDVHGATMSGEVMRVNNRLHELAPPEGYIAVQPTAPSGAWDLRGDPPAIADFIERMIAAFHLNTRRIHITGFSMGSGVSFWFLCNRPDLIASAGPVTGKSADQVRVQDTDMSCIEALDSAWQPRVPILFMSGTEDTALSIDAARQRTEGIVARLGLQGGDEVDGDSQWRRRRWTGADAMVFEFLEHDYAGAVAGHCIPGPTPDPIYGCTSGGVTLDWGETVLQFFVRHPKP